MTNIEELAENVNEQIGRMTKYGMRTVTTHKRGYELSWSNSGQKWNIYSRALPAGSYKIDANHIIVEAPSTAIQELLPLLIDLPLYSNSRQAFRRGTENDLFDPYHKEYYDEDRKSKKVTKPKRKVTKKKGCGCK